MIVFFSENRLGQKIRGFVEKVYVRVKEVFVTSFSIILRNSYTLGQKIRGFVEKIRNGLSSTQ